VLLVMGVFAQLAHCTLNDIMISNRQPSRSVLSDKSLARAWLRFSVAERVGSETPSSPCTQVTSQIAAAPGEQSRPAPERPR